MKKLLCLLLGGTIALSVLLSGCGCSDSSAQDSDSSQSVEPTDTKVKTTGSKVHINDSSLGDIWISELDGVPLNKLDNNNFTSDDSFKYYSENGQPASKEGIDISYYSGDIDWDKVKQSGIDFVMVRLGGRGYGNDGPLYTDEKAVEYLNGAKKAGLKVGAYLFSQATTNDEAVEEASYVKEILGDIKLDYPIAFDWEIIKNDNARTDSVSANQATQCAKAFCEKIKDYGYKPMIYSPSRELYFKYDLSQLADFDIWYCEYADVPTFYYEFSMWQYSATGTVDGIDGPVDLNICFTSVADYD